MALRGLDDRLPRGTVRKGRVAGGGRFHVDTGIIELSSKSTRTRYHEKGHYIWNRRMAAPEKAAWRHEVQRHLRPRVGRRTAKRAARPRAAEEVWAEAYAAHKLRRPFPNRLGAFVARLLRA